MKKNFVFVLPDEPYKTTTDLNISVNATYTGPRYVVARVENSSKTVNGVVHGSDKLEDINLEQFIEEGHTFFIIDADVNTLEASYLTGQYEHEEIPDPTFDLPNGLPSYTYHYSDSQALAQIHYNFDLKYDATTKTFTKPRYRTHALTRESVFESCRNNAKTIRESLAANDYTPEDKTALENYAEWLDNLETICEGVDHWKIVFPSNIPPLV